MIDLDSLVDIRNRTVSPAIYWDPEIYRLEQERIFARCWNVVGHVSQVAKPHDYVTSWVGEESVFITRDAGGKIHVLLNSCPHRAATVCRQEKGSAKAFTCPYHGWTFRNTGELIGVPGYEENYAGKLDKKAWGLISARVEVLYGLIFACFDPKTPSLDEFLGEMKWYLQLSLDRTEAGMEVLMGTEKMIIDANWKLQSDQFSGDNYHSNSLHRAMLLLFPNANFNDNSANNYQVRCAAGHAYLSVESTTNDVPGQPEIAAWIHKQVDIRKARMNAAQAKLVKANAAAIFNIFPNLSALVLPEFTQLRLNLPMGPNKHKLLYMCLVDKEAPDSFKEWSAKFLALNFSSSGIFELEDGTVWAEGTSSLRGAIRQRQPLNFQLGMGRERTEPEMPGMISFRPPTEDGVFGFYQGWHAAMNTAPIGSKKAKLYAAG